MVSYSNLKISYIYIDSNKIFIIGYCFAKCQQQFAACLLAQMNEVVSSSLDYCENMSKKCEINCYNDKRTSRVAEANWSKVVQILQQFNPSLATDDIQNHK